MSGPPPGVRVRRCYARGDDLYVEKEEGGWSHDGAPAHPPPPGTTIRGCFDHDGVFYHQLADDQYYERHNRSFVSEEGNGFYTPPLREMAEPPSGVTLGRCYWYGAGFREDSIFEKDGSWREKESLWCDACNEYHYKRAEPPSPDTEVRGCFEHEGVFYVQLYLESRYREYHNHNSYF